MSKDEKDFNSVYNDKDYLIKELKIECDLNKKKLSEEKKKLKEKTEQYEEKLKEMKALAGENEKLKLKIKEINFLKDKSFNFDDYLNNIEQKNKLIENSVKEKQEMMQQYEKLKKELLNEKERIKIIEQDRKRLEFELQDFKEMNKFERKYGGGFGNESISMFNNRFNTSEIIAQDKHANNNILDFEKDSFIGELTGKVTGERAKNYEREIQELIQEKTDITRNYRSQIDEIHKLIDEKDRLLNQNDELKLELDRVNNERDKLIIEKEKLELQKQKKELEFEKSGLNNEKIELDKKKIEEENKELAEQNKLLENEKNIISKEIENLKKQLRTSNAYIEKIFSEKQIMQQNLQNLKIEFDKYKTSNGSGANDSSEKLTAVNNKKISPKNSVVNQSIGDNENVAILKAEIQSIKNNLVQKDEIIRNLRDKVRVLEKNEISLTESNSNIDLKKGDDLDYYKKSFEEQKVRVNKEHEVIASSLYELTIQFMSLKTELQKRVTSIYGNKNP